MQLRLSSINPYLRKTKKQNARSAYEFVNDKDEQKIGEKLRAWIVKQDSKGSEICAPTGAKKLANRVIHAVAKKQVRKKRIQKQDRSKFISMFFNYQHMNQLYRNANSCCSHSHHELDEKSNTIENLFSGWKSTEIIKCLEARRKTIKPEDEDFERLGEAVLNKEKSGKKILFVTGDWHFHCYSEEIANDLEIKVINFREF